MHPNYIQKKLQAKHEYILLNLQKVYREDEQNDIKIFEIFEYQQNKLKDS